MSSSSSVEEDKQQEEEPENELLTINKDQQQTTEQQTNKEDSNFDVDNILANQDQKGQVDLKAMAGFDMDTWTRVYGTIADANTKIQMQLSPLKSYNIGYNKSGDIYTPSWGLLELVYHSVTQGALEQRQTLLAEIDDLQRQQQTVNLRIQEMQTEIKERQTRQYKGEPYQNKRVSIENASIEELQENIKTLEQFPQNIAKDINRKKIDANWLGFKMYFHITDRKVFDNCRGDQIENIVRACDQKQIGIPKNEAPLKNSGLQARQGVS